MKRIAILTLAGVVAFTACTKENEQDLNKYTYRFQLDGGNEVRSVLGENCVEWEEGDKVGTYVLSNTNIAVMRNIETSVDMSTTPVSLRFTTSQALSHGQKVCFTSPRRNVDQDNCIPVQIPDMQVMNSNNKLNCNAMPMVSVPIVVDSSVAEGNLVYAGEAVKMLCFGSIIEFRIYTSNSKYSTEKVKSVRFVSEDYIVSSYIPIEAHRIDLSNLSTLDYVIHSGSNTAYTTLATPMNPGSSKESYLKVCMVVSPGSHKGTVTVNTDRATYTYNVDSKTFVRAAVKPLNVNLDTGSRQEAARTTYRRTRSEGVFVDGGKYLLALVDGQTLESLYFLKQSSSTYNNLELKTNFAQNDIVENPDNQYVFTAHKTDVLTPNSFYFTSGDEKSSGYLYASGAAIYTCKALEGKLTNNYKWTPLFQDTGGVYFLQNGEKNYYLVYYQLNTVKAYKTVNNPLRKGTIINTEDGAIAVFKKVE